MKEWLLTEWYVTEKLHSEETHGETSSHLLLFSIKLCVKRIFGLYIKFKVLLNLTTFECHEFRLPLELVTNLISKSLLFQL